MTVNQKRIVLILVGLLIFIATFFLIFQKNMDKVTKLETENADLNKQVDYLSQLQIRVNEMKATSEQKLQETEAYTQDFPCKMTQQKVISSLYRLWVDSGMNLKSIKPGAEQTFFKDGKFLSLTGDAAPEGEAQSTEPTEAELNPEVKVPIHEMVGKTTSYDLEITGTREQILKAFDWLADNKEHMSLTKISLAFDESTGKLTGSLTVNFYCLNGNGVPYEEPDISGIIIGNKDVFATFKKKKKNK